MDVEAKRPPMSEVWTQLEGRVVNGTLPLHRCLGSSDHSGVFLTEYAPQSLPRAALKLVPAIPTLAESQLSHWHAAAALHPHLIRLFEAGRCQIGGLHYLYVVMDYAEQNLGQLLQHRPLSEAEVREMLPLTLDALGFLHSRDLVQGQLKPSNILVIDNQLKLASDTIRPAGEATASIGSLSMYNPPEARDGSFSTSGDIWALGVTLCQALTQRPPSRSGERGENVVLPTDFPVTFIDIVRRCLARNPAQRPSVADLQGWLKPGATEPAVSTPPPADVAKPPAAETPTRLVIRAVLNSEPAAEVSPERKSPAVPIAVVVAILAIVGLGVYWFKGRSNTDAPMTETASTAAPTSTSPTAAAQTSGAQPALPPVAPSASADSNDHVPPTRAPVNHSRPTDAESGLPSAVLHEEIPTVPLSARQTIHGRVKVTVRVTVDKAGSVISDVLETPGPSKYFARVAGQAASKWKFVPAADGHASRQWLVQFEFSRDGTKAHAVTRN
ncbi:MAG: serine/threonine protein kinase [Gammaproteobacteria bacterium]|nr:serine/threonine protein kinase [Gammaproteobacteria bacterium]